MQAEVDRLIFEDADPETGFLLHPDLKWVSIPASLFCLPAPICCDPLKGWSCLQVQIVVLHTINRGKTCMTIWQDEMGTAYCRMSASQRRCTASPW